MAYAREEKQTFEIDYSLEKVWAAIPQTIETLDWTIEETDDRAYKAKIKSRPGFFAYSTILNVELKSVDEKTTKLSINAETPVTTITSIADFGRTRDRLEQFVDTLAKELDNKKTNVKSE
jgi:carbon monoxide dehydrogenase subunit G